MNEAAPELEVRLSRHLLARALRRILELTTCGDAEIERLAARQLRHVLEPLPPGSRPEA
jgi:hypothetical protein